MRKLKTTAVERKRVQAKRTLRNARSKQKAATWRKRWPAAVAAEKAAQLKAAAEKKTEDES